jgi:uncharacterized protein YbcI
MYRTATSTAEDERMVLQGGQLLASLSGEMVTIFRDAVGKGPERCKAYWAGTDLLVVVLDGGFSVAERTLFAAGRGATVQAQRLALQQTLAERMKAKVTELTGREVVALLAASHQEPDLSVEIFVLEPCRTDAG